MNAVVGWNNAGREPETPGIEPVGRPSSGLGGPAFGEMVDRHRSKQGGRQDPGLARVEADVERARGHVHRQMRHHRIGTGQGDRELRQLHRIWQDGEKQAQANGGALTPGQERTLARRAEAAGGGRGAQTGDPRTAGPTQAPTQAPTQNAPLQPVSRSVALPGLPPTQDSFQNDFTPAVPLSPSAAPTVAPAPASSDQGVVLDPSQVDGPTGGAGPNAIVVKNAFDHPITLGQFVNGNPNPVSTITLQPGQVGLFRHADGQAGFIAKADANGQFQPDASRLEYETDPDGKMSFPDVSYIDGRNAAISLTDGQGLNKGDQKSIVGGAPAGTVSTDADGDATEVGFYDGQTDAEQRSSAYEVSAIGTDGAYLHPDDDRLPAGQNPMSGTTAKTLFASFAPP